MPGPNMAINLAEAMGATPEEARRARYLAERVMSSRAAGAETGLPADRTVVHGDVVLPPVPMSQHRSLRNLSEGAAVGDTYITINGSVDQVQLPPSLAAAAAREDALDPDVALQQLSQALRKARVKAGKPLLKTLGRAIDYSESMLSRVFAGKRVPPRDKLETLAEQLGIDTRTFTTIWVPLWEAANRKRVEGAFKTGEVTQPVAAPTGLAGSETFVCAACKGLIRLGDAPDHIAWHVSLGQDQFRTASVTPLRSV
ncbi:helix-turn-helix domain-containing protein [Actinoplanes xinjiangensis]|uniref:helix-turn-helix domain-containing protein n=1 Tax=Actinoplanes xinjiangensis TaxID=512350 RepID=UPI003429CDCE